MVSSFKLLSTASFMSALLITPTAAVWTRRGLAANDDINISGFNGGGSQVNWQYNWDSTTTVNKQTWAEYIPMLWGTGSDHTSVWWSNVYYWIRVGGSGHVLSFNEPEQSGQANLSPGDAANAYMTYIQPLASEAQIGAPAVSNDGYSWMQQFLSACSGLGCHIDFIAIHWYNDASQFSDFQNWVNSICAFGHTVWITEV